jgi:hypothetical protein
VGVVVVVAAGRGTPTLKNWRERAVKEYWRIEFRTVWKGAASRSMKIVVRTIGSR